MIKSHGPPHEFPLRGPPHSPPHFQLFLLATMSNFRWYFYPFQSDAWWNAPPILTLSRFLTFHLWRLNIYFHFQFPRCYNALHPVPLDLCKSLIFPFFSKAVYIWIYLFYLLFFLINKQIFQHSPFFFNNKENSAERVLTPICMAPLLKVTDFHLYTFLPYSFLLTNSCT